MSTWKSLIILAVPLMASLIIVQLIRIGPGENPDSSNIGAVGQLDPLASLFVGVGVLFLLFYGLRRYGQKTARFIVSGVIFGGILSGLLVLRLLLQPETVSHVLFYILAAPLAYVGLYYGVKSYTGSISRKKNLFLEIISATTIGTLVGVAVPLVFSLALLVGLSLLDAFLIDFGLVRKLVPHGDYGSVIDLTTVPLGDFGIGIGDIMCYSILVSNSMRNLGVFVGTATVFFILLGVIATAKLASTRLRAPGLPLPIWLGLLPVIVGVVLT